MSPLSAFGVIAVSAMLLFYSVEERAPLFILLFAGACLASSVYGFLQGAWPFGLVEGIWTAVAIQRWRRRDGSISTRPQPAARFACDMNAFTEDERRRYALRATVTAAINRVVDLPNGYRVRLGQGVTSGEVGEWMSLEQRCCPFLTLTLELQEDGAIWLAVTGRPGVQKVLESEFAALSVNKP